LAGKLREEVQNLNKGVNEALKLLRRMTKKINPVADQEYHESVMSSSFGLQQSEDFLLRARTVEQITAINEVLAVRDISVSAVSNYFTYLLSLLF
jgi:archaellum component FlaC